MTWIHQDETADLPIIVKSASLLPKAAQAIIEKSIEVGVSVLAITNHNDVSGVPAFRDAAAGRNIHVFPGFELRSSEGVHVLCIYPQDTDDGQLERF
ncbi:MAG: PHP domain-containing protein, partial [Proteobacteria bacterium]|nr:PHP domain-containing protein [Pseudomonadota bacterium]